jgi:hypothetical protein
MHSIFLSSLCLFDKQKRAPGGHDQKSKSLQSGHGYIPKRLQRREVVVTSLWLTNMQMIGLHRFHPISISDGNFDEKPALRNLQLFGLQTHSFDVRPETIG